MFFWFIGLSFALVALVFSSPALDYRLVFSAAAVPVVEVIVGGPWVLHTLIAPVTVLAIVMLATQGKRLDRRRWLAVPIGLFMHLVLDGTWSTSKLFWWPFLGASSVLGEGRLPEFERSWGLLVVMEAVGVLVLTLLVRRFDLLGEGRNRFARSGQLLREKFQ